MTFAILQKLKNIFCECCSTCTFGGIARASMGAYPLHVADVRSIAINPFRGYLLRVSVLGGLEA